MIVVLKIITGEEVIGILECETDEEFNNLEQYEVIEPMWITPGEYGAMKLRDALMLSQDEALIFIPETIITCYKPSVNLINYYSRASEYSRSIARKSINTQIDMATEEMDEMLREEAMSTRITDALHKISKSKLH